MRNDIRSLLRRAAILERQGKLDEALEQYLKILKQFPNNKEANSKAKKISIRLKNLSEKTEANFLFQLYSQKKFEVAKERLKSSIRDFPKSEIIWNIYGAVHKSLQNLTEAKIGFERVIQINSNNAHAFNNLAVVMKQLGDVNGAEQNYLKALQIDPGYAEAYYNLGNIYRFKKEFSNAIKYFNKSIKIAPRNSDTHFNLGLVYWEIDEPQRALETLNVAASLNPNNEKIYNYLGVIHVALGSLKRAFSCYESALSINPEYIDALTNKGSLLGKLGKFEEAVESLKVALTIDPKNDIAWNNLAIIHSNVNRPDLAIKYYQRSLEINPDNFLAKSQCVHQQQKICDFVSEQEITKIIHKIKDSDHLIPPFTSLAWCDDPAFQLERSKIYAKSINLDSKPVGLENIKKQREVIRIGYFSADFHTHATMFLISGLLRSHNKSRFEVFLYSYGDNKHDAVHTDLKSTTANFFDISELNNAEISELAITHDLHIAVDLKGYTQKGRSDIFGVRLAPVQLNYLGFPGTLGSNCFDFIIADQIVIPKKYRKFYTEKIIYLPDCYQPNDNRRIVSARKSNRSEFGLPETGFVFCCFNANYKISSREFKIWMSILKRVPESVLWLLKSNKWAEANLRASAKYLKVDPSRIIFAEKIANAEHLERHRHADLFLDTFNVNAHTTASDALWTSTPVLTKAGKQFAARVSASLLSSIGMTELICDDEKTYEELAIRLATESELFRTIRNKLNRNIKDYTLFDTDTYTGNFEKGLECALSSVLAGKKPSDIWISNPV